MKHFYNAGRFCSNSFWVFWNFIFSNMKCIWLYYLHVSENQCPNEIHECILWLIVFSMYCLISNAKCFYPHWNSKGIQNHGKVHELKRKKKVADNEEKHKEKTLARKWVQWRSTKVKNGGKAEWSSLQGRFPGMEKSCTGGGPWIIHGTWPEFNRLFRNSDGKENSDALNTALLSSDLFIRFMLPTEHLLEKVTMLKNFAKPSCHGLWPSGVPEEKSPNLELL